MLRGTLETKNYLTFSIGGEAAPQLTTATVAAACGLPGDTVEMEDGGVSLRLVTRADHGLLVGVLELAAKVRHGMTSRGALLFRFSPWNEAYPPFFVGCSSKDTSQNVLARIQVSDWHAGESCPRGLLVQTFGPAGDLATEEEALLVHYGPVRWKRGEVLMPAEVAVLAASLPARTFHIDPPGCRDIDDAITIIDEPTTDTRTLLIHIADVASWLIAAPAEIRAKASAAGQTLYRDGVAVRPMLPLELSEGALSLLPGALRGAVTLRSCWRSGVLVGQPSWELGHIRVDESHTYETAAAAWFAPALTEITSGLAQRPVTDSHEWIEQLMIFYNREAAAELRRRGLGILRRHAVPDQELLERFAALGLPAERMASKAGEYCLATEEQVQHWGLGQAFYCHATSPIRRWSDCLNQLALRGALKECDPADVAGLNAAAKRAKAYERDLTFLRALVGPGAQKEVDAILVEEGRIWVPCLGRVVRAETGAGAPGLSMRVALFCDASKRNWKRRLVIRCLSRPQH